MGSGSFSVSGSGSVSSLVLDGERGELVRAPVVRLGKKGGAKGSLLDEKAVIALRNHSEAERRRRERINSHLAVLRGMISGTEKLDKAALLAEVINHVKLLKATATEQAKGYTMPSDTDEVTILCEPQTANTTNTSFLIYASICCDDSPELYPELKLSLRNLYARVVRAEISSLSGRVKIVFVIMPERGGSDEVGKNILVDSVQHALRSVLDKVNSSIEFMPRTSLLNKRRKVSQFESSSSSS
ncbi:basic helix-loop-helix (bHLH) DNA-binding superfamily protein [Rhynchospora pubera]|uniref:Basic helix-loop-helix (BHLH) DNA-binding superfamily protein n=1 Tax=Rhynchospora pubera TaxID=906938 RepID=A0AAV8DFB1_9POAL|nr:basic helix-loop-helix (bHLH) DNA-binding superfamily protein [Rhynchospora pubera]